MSNKVTLTTNPVELKNGEVVGLASDGSIRRVNSDMKVGSDASEYDMAVTPSGMKAVRRAIPLILGAAELEKKLAAIKSKLDSIGGGSSDSGELRFVGDDGGEDDHTDIGVGVGCTFVKANELPKVLKALGIK